MWEVGHGGGQGRRLRHACYGAMLTVHMRRVPLVHRLQQVYKGVMNETVLVSVIIMSPMLSSLATFATYAWLGNELTAARVFTAVALFGMVRLRALWRSSLVFFRHSALTSGPSSPVHCRCRFEFR